MNKREEEILVNLYRFRFLTKDNLQCLLKQSYHSRLVNIHNCDLPKVFESNRFW